MIFVYTSSNIHFNVRLGVRRKLLPTRVLTHWKTLCKPRSIQDQVWMGLGASWSSSRCSCQWQGRWNSVIVKALFSSNHSMILCSTKVPFLPHSLFPSSLSVYHALTLLSFYGTLQTPWQTSTQLEDQVDKGPATRFLWDLGLHFRQLFTQDTMAFKIKTLCYQHWRLSRQYCFQYFTAAGYTTAKNIPTPTLTCTYKHSHLKNIANVWVWVEL